MKFFKPEDIEPICNEANNTNTWKDLLEVHCKRLNTLLESRGKVVYTSYTDLSYPWIWWNYNDDKERTYRALLISIEPIKVCTHSKEKISMMCSDTTGVTYTCMCGVRVKPKAFEVVG